MASGSFSKNIISGNSNYALIVDWSSTPNTSANTSVVKATVKLKVYSLYINARTDNYVTINGKTYYFDSAAISKSSPTTVTLGTVTSSAIAHNADGSKSISIKAGFKLQATISGTYYGTVTASDTVALDEIPRASSVSSGSANVGSALTISISRASSSFTHTLTYTFGSLSGTIATKTTSTSVKWTLPDSFYAQMASVKTKTGTITCTTYSGSTAIGTSTSSFTAKVSSASAPSLTPTVVDSDSAAKALTGDTAKFIKGYSDAAFVVAASAKNSATIKSYKVTCGAKSSTSATGTFANVESGTFVFSVTDSRGYTTSKTIEKTLINYVKLTCNMVCGNPTATGDMALTVSGNCFNGSFGDVTNTLTVQYRMSSDGGTTWGSWTDLAATKSGSTYNAALAITGLDYRTVYTFQARAVDKLATVTTATQTIKALPVFEWGADKFVHNTNLYMAENGYGGGMIYGVLPDGQTFVGNVQPVSENGNCVIGWGNYDRGAGNTHLYGGKTVDMFVNGASDHVFRARNDNGHMLINKAGYDDADSDTYVYGNDVGVRTKGSFLITSPDAGLSSRAYGVNKVLASGAQYMSADHTWTLDEAISAQPHGIVLVFSAYRDGAAKDYEWTMHFVPKYIVGINNGGGHSFPMNSGSFGYIGTKYLYITDTKISGNASNVAAGTSNGVTYANNAYVLRYVIGV